MNGERLCGYYLGARLTDVTNLTWENVDLGNAYDMEIVDYH